MVDSGKVSQVVDLMLAVKPDPQGLVRYGVISAITGSTVTVTVGNAPTPIPGLHHMSSYGPTVGDSVVLLQSGASYIVLGKLS